MTTGARAVATALVLAEDGRRQDGRWKRGTIRDIGGSSDIDSAWELSLKHAGTVLDYTPDLAEAVVNGGHGPRRAGLLVVDDAGHEHRHPPVLRRSDGFDSVLVEQHSESVLRHVQRERRHVRNLLRREVVG